MPTLNLFTNLPVDAVVASDILKDATKAVSKIIGKPESVKSPFSLLLCSFCWCIWYEHKLFDENTQWNSKLYQYGISGLHYKLHIHFVFRFHILQYVMILLNGSVPMAFAGTEEPAAYGELISIGGIGPSVNGKLSSTIAEILETKLSIDSSRFYIKFYDVEVSPITCLLH